MSLEILKKAKSNLGHLRRTGSTTVLKTLYNQIPNFVLVTNNYIYGTKLKKEIDHKQGKVTVLSVLGASNEDLRGIHDPVAVDTSALLEVLELSICTIESKESHIEFLKAQVHKLDRMFKELGHYLQRFYPRHFDEKRWNKRDGMDYDKIDEANRILGLAYHVINHQYRLYSKLNTTIRAVKYNRIKIKEHQSKR